MCMQLLLECSVGVNEFGLIDAAVQVVYFLASFLSRPSINYRDRVLKPPDIVVECPISPINFVKFCCMYFEALNFCASKFTLVISHISGCFHHYKMSNSVSRNTFCLKSLLCLLLSWPRQRTLAAELSVDHPLSFPSPWVYVIVGSISPAKSI